MAELLRTPAAGPVGHGTNGRRTRDDVIHSPMRVRDHGVTEVDPEARCGVERVPGSSPQLLVLRREAT
ncbi:hypothetical protein GSU68_07585 [Rathayibacter sp. VKM Ac-2759]|uniref:hypothetical protein n=1 Tax=Rathayibacter sp. VKM Ac-2759 TaxID=2609252 RepID=UPI001318093B|nr:hypothetical protein [Rathayibacter sp. VKM Ac-2759]QHC66455.1 hypothetical protein GSU68_07585 [Rathayibacter sp. VKM Ac-2759]